MSGVPKSKRPVELIRVRLDLEPNVKAALDELAYQRRQSVASLTREVMSAWVAAESTPAPTPKTAKKKNL